MSSSPTHSSPNAETQTCPVLTDVEIDRARPYGRVRQAQLGEILYRPGEVGASCYILLSATVQIVQPSIDGERLITNHCPGTFTGEAGMIAGQRTLVLARVIQGGEVLELRPEGLRTLVARDAGLSEIFLRAFVLRRLLLINRQLGNAVVIGSRHSADTLRLREFLGRNGHPYTYVDLDLDDASRNLLDRFAIAVSEIPIVICNGTTVYFQVTRPNYGRMLPKVSTTYRKINLRMIRQSWLVLCQQIGARAWLISRNGSPANRQRNRLTR